MKVLIDIPEEDYKHLAYANHFKLRSYIENGKIVDEDESAKEPCEDAISRQAVLDMLEDINAETEGVGFYYTHYVEYIKKLPPVKPNYTDAEIQKMQDLEFAEIQKAYEIGKDEGSEENPNKWIPVSERLPEEGERVLATHLGGLNPHKQVIEHIYVNGRFTQNWDMDMNLGSPTFGQRYMGEVIAWMPLPEPYKASPTGAESEDKE